MAKYYSSTPPKDLSRPRKRDPKPGNPEIMKALAGALARSDSEGW